MSDPNDITDDAMPIDPGPSDWALPDPGVLDDDHPLVGIGADLEPSTILAAYRSGSFPMPVRGVDVHGEPTGDDELDPDDALGWWSPDPRGVLPLDELKVSRSLRRSMRDHTITFDTDFDAVIAHCAAPDRDGRWITDEFVAAYRRLHDMGWVHSVEARDATTGGLVGGLYGVHIDGFFAGESMFHLRRDASKVALVGLVDHLRSIGVVLLDVQWLTPHLATLGAVEIPRLEYLERLRDALGVPGRPFASASSS